MNLCIASRLAKTGSKHRHHGQMNLWIAARLAKQALRAFTMAKWNCGLQQGWPNRLYVPSTRLNETVDRSKVGQNRWIDILYVQQANIPEYFCHLVRRKVRSTDAHPTIIKNANTYEWKNLFSYYGRWIPLPQHLNIPLLDSTSLSLSKMYCTTKNHKSCILHRSIFTERERERERK